LSYNIGGIKLTERERFLKVMHFEPVDRIPYWDFGFWDETPLRWKEEGLPEDLDLSYPSLVEFFGMDKNWEAGGEVGVSLGMIPSFEPVVLENLGDVEVIIDHTGVKQKRNKMGSSIPQFLEFPVKNRKDFNEMIKRYNPDDPRRYPQNWEELKGKWKNRDYPLGIFFGGFFGWIRDWMGLENTVMTFYDDPKLISDMMDFIVDFVKKTIHRALDEVEIDFTHGWEDMAYNKGPLISPKLFKEFMLPRYKEITSFLREHGIDIIIVDSDGNIEELIPLWLEGGVNCMFPMEIGIWKADLIALRKKYGKNLLMIGGIDKHALIEGKSSIKEEVYSKIPLIQEGGYIPTPDHRVPPDVPLDNYLYYLTLIKYVGKKYAKH
jgi:uroporphyrinogen decarboxylase